LERRLLGTTLPKAENLQQLQSWFRELLGGVGSAKKLLETPGTFKLRNPFRRRD